MSRYCGSKDPAPILNAANHWKKTCLLDSKSVFGFGDIWSPDNNNSLITHYVNNLDEGEGNFLEKLEKQLEPASDAAKILCAEMLWLMLLCPSDIGPQKKRDNLEAILSWANKTLPADDTTLGDRALTGVGSAGTAYNNLRWKELVYCILLFKQFLELGKDEREQLLSNSEIFANWCEKIPDNESRQLRHMLLYLLFPIQLNVFSVTAYLKNIEYREGANRIYEGLLLYPVVEQQWRLEYQIHGYRVRICTVDLAAHWSEIRAELLALISDF